MNDIFLQIVLLLLITEFVTKIKECIQSHFPIMIISSVTKNNKPTFLEHY